MKKYFKDSVYVVDPQTNVLARPEYAGIAYNDGDETEMRIAGIIEKASDITVLSTELRQHCTDWASTYHLHPNRANLLRPVESYIKGDVLEIGCGCGAITRFLGESGANVLALEGSPRRAKIAASRTRDLNNVTIISDKFNDFKCDQKFDVVTFIGVLEYARKYSNDQTQDGIDLALKLAASYLKQDGILIIAIENQLGLKYFAGFYEDHFGKLMYGIEDHYDENSIVTFGRKELGDRVAKTGLSQHQWWFPFPDYKLPTLLVSEVGVNLSKEFNLTTLAKSASANDMQYPKNINFMQERALSPVIRNNLLPELANSFLLVASSQKQTKKQDMPLAIHYAVDRKPEFTKKVVFGKDEKDNVIVRSLTLSGVRGSEEKLPLKQILSDVPYCNGEIWQDKLFDLVTSPGWTFDEIKNWFEPWLNAFCKHANILNSSNLVNIKVAGDLFDAIPRNLVMDRKGNPIFIDQEWSYAEELEVSYIIFRALLISFSSLRYVAEPYDISNLNVLDLIKELMNSKNLNLNEIQLAKFAHHELTLALLSKGFMSHSHTNLIIWIQSLKLSVVKNHITLSEQIEERDRQIEERDRQIEERDQQILTIKSSNSWKLTGPFRLVGRSFRKCSKKIS
jgi:2-polyprenyl-3-methyl-5-hydroxy-6-metoxy-1,4-benzoquinol methylase